MEPSKKNEKWVKVMEIVRLFQWIVVAVEPGKGGFPRRSSGKEVESGVNG